MTHKLQDDTVHLGGSGQDEANRRRAMRAIVVSSLGLAATSAFELLISALSGSAALLSDALHNLGAVFTTVGVYFGFRVSKKEPTARYPYGYGRAENLAAILILLAIWTSARLVDASLDVVDRPPSSRWSLTLAATSVTLSRCRRKPGTGLDRCHPQTDSLLASPADRPISRPRADPPMDYGA
jgi:hypothetical protein